MLPRVYELATELGVESRAVLGTLKELGFYVRSALSTLDQRAVRAVREKITGLPVEEVQSTWPSTIIVRTTPMELRDPILERAWAARASRSVVTRAEPHEELTAEELGQRLTVAPATIRKWASRGYLTAAGQRGRSRLYRYGDAVRVRDEARARRRQAFSPPPISELRWMNVRPVTAAEAARLAGVSPSTIRTWVRRGRLTPLDADVRPMTFDASRVVELAERQYDKRWTT